MSEQVGDHVEVDFEGAWHAARIIQLVPAGVKVRFDEDSSVSVISQADASARLRPGKAGGEAKKSEAPTKAKRAPVALQDALAKAQSGAEPAAKRAKGSHGGSSGSGGSGSKAPKKLAAAAEESGDGGGGSGGKVPEKPTAADEESGGGSGSKRPKGKAAAAGGASAQFSEVPLSEWSSREAVATTLSASQKANMAAAQAIARKHLAALAAEPQASAAEKKQQPGGRRTAPTTAMVLEVLTAVGDTEAWPKQTRPNVTDTGKPVAGMCLGLVFGLGGGGAKASLISESYPDLARLIVLWCAATLPKTRDGQPFPFSSLQINFKYRAKKHVDGNNIGPSYIQAIGPHSGGALWTADRGVLDCRHQWRLFDGNQAHATETFKGTRISFIAFTHGLYNKLTPWVAQQLQRLGFNAARSDGKDLPFFEAFRIEKNYLSEDHNGAFKAFREKRAAQAMPPPHHPGAVAVECYGRQAERGGGWVSFARGSSSLGAACAVELVDLRPNTTGLWCTELDLALTARGAASLTLVGHRQFNLYKDLIKETAALNAYVAGLPTGRVVVASIADTACAASRPLGPKVYEALQQLGAAADMEPIAYRQAWALIGWKGAPPGAAVHSMGKRATLLRLEGTFALKPAGKGKLATALVDKKEDRTSIVDVVTGGGQDCAV